MNLTITGSLTPEEKARLDQAFGDAPVSEAGATGLRNMLAKVAETAYKNMTPQQKQALTEAMEGAGRRIMQTRIKDPNYLPETSWAKMEHVLRNPDSTKTVVHYWRNLQTNIGEFFKFK